MGRRTRHDNRPGIAIRIGAAWLLAPGALAFAGWTGEYVETAFGAGRYLRYGLQALTMSGLVVPSILWSAPQTVAARTMEGRSWVRKITTDVEKGNECQVLLSRLPLHESGWRQPPSSRRARFRFRAASS